MEKGKGHVLLEKIIDYIWLYIRPSLVKVACALISAGILTLTPAWWVSIVNFALEQQNFYPDLKVPVFPTDHLTGWGLVIIGVIVFVFERYMQVRQIAVEQTSIPDINDFSKQTASEVVEALLDNGITVPNGQDEKILQRLNEITALRFFGSYPNCSKVIELAEMILTGELRGGSRNLKAKALALLGRYISHDDIELCNSYISESRRLASTDELLVADAFLASARGNISEAIQTLLNNLTPLNLSATFIIKRNYHGDNDAITWLFKSGLTITSLDSDGQQSLISALLNTKQWQRALEEVERLGNHKEIKSVSLAHWAAFAYLCNSINVDDLKEAVLQNIPFAAELFPLADDLQSVQHRLKAIDLFSVSSSLAKSFSADEISILSDKYALWLRLRTTDTQAEAYDELLEHFSDVSITALKYLPFAHAFRLNLDFPKIELELNKLSALYGVKNTDIGIARFVLAHKKESYTAALVYIRNHRESIEYAVGSDWFKMFEIEALAGSGLVDEADKLLLDDCSIDEEQKKRIKNVIAAKRGENPVALVIAQYKESNNISDLSRLVSLLSASGLNDEYLNYASELWSHTKAESDAIELANAYSKTGRFSELDQFLLDNKDIVEKSKPLLIHKAWTHFRNGELKACSELVNRLIVIEDFRLDVEKIEIHLQIYSGNWSALASIVEKRWDEKDKLKNYQLVETANIAKSVLPERAKDILEYATQRFPDDPEVLAAAYITATSLGWESSDVSSDWLGRAASLSSEGDGPIRTASFDELKSLISEQRVRSQKIYKAYLDNDAPIFTIAKLLNRSLSDFYLIQPSENIKISAPFRKSIIAAFDNTRKEKIISTHSIAIDVSSALVLGYIGRLDLLFSNFEKIIIPHSFFFWLYEEKQKNSFHQPSQIEKAKEFESLLLDEFIQVVNPTIIQDPKLALSVGDELAMLLEISKANEEYGSQCLVVCSYPCYRVNSFRSEEVDLSNYKNNIISCVALLNRLNALSMLNDSEYQSSIRYLERNQHGNVWPEEPKIEAGAAIYLDSLTLDYLLDMGLLDRFKKAGINIYVHYQDRIRYKALRTYDATVKKVGIILDKVKSAFEDGLRSGQVSLSKSRERLDDNENFFSTSPTSELFQEGFCFTAIVIDDRYINKHSHIELGSNNVEIYTTLDLLFTLFKNEILDADSYFSYLSLLRDSGFCVVSMSEREIHYHLEKSSVKDNKICPTRELKAMKDHLSLLKTSGTIKLPRDADWLLATLKSLSRSIFRQWTIDISLDERIARSNWLYELIDFRSWAQCHEIRHEDGLGYNGEFLRVNLLLVVPAENIDKNLKSEYESWVESHVLIPLKENDLASFNILVSSLKRQIAKTTDKGISKLQELSHG